MKTPLILAFGGAFALVMGLISRSLAPDAEDFVEAHRIRRSDPIGGIEPWRRFRLEAVSATTGRTKPPANTPADPVEQAAPDVAGQSEMGSGPFISAAVSRDLPRTTDSSLRDIAIAFRQNRHRGRRAAAAWVRRSTLTLALPGNQTAVEVKPQGYDARGQMVEISPEWAPSDRSMLSVLPSPRGDGAVVITVLCAGHTRLNMVFQGFSKTISIIATDQEGAMHVEISQE